MKQQEVNLFETNLNYVDNNGMTMWIPSVSFERDAYVSIPESVATPEELIAAIEKTGHVKLEEDIELTDKPLEIKGDALIELGSKKIIGGLFTESGGSVNAGNSDSYGVWAKSGTVVLSGNGEVQAQPAQYSMAVWANGGDVIIDGGTYTNGGDGCDLIYASGNSKVIINGGTFKATPKAGVEPGTANEYSCLNIKDKDRGTASITVYGGSFYKFDPANNLSEGPGTNFVADGYESVQDGDWFIVRRKNA